MSAKGVSKLLLKTKQKLLFMVDAFFLLFCERWRVSFTFCSEVLGPGFLCLPGISAKCGNDVLIPRKGVTEPTDSLVRPFCLDLYTLGWHAFSVM